MPHRVDQPEIRRWYSRMLLERNAAGDRERAGACLVEARSLYEQLGMSFHLALVDTQLDRF